MKLVLTLLVHNERDLVEANIAYHLAQGVDHVVVTDNRSTDGARELVDGLARGGQVTVIDEPGDDYRQAQWVTRMARVAGGLGADWVVHCDSDELWYAQAGDLKSAFASLPAATGAILAPRSNMLPLRRLAGHPFERLVMRHVESRNAVGDPLPGKVAHRPSPDVELTPGNHSLVSARLGPPVAVATLSILHYPYRGYDGFAEKVSTGGAAIARNVELPEEEAATWRYLYALHEAGELRAWYDALLHADDPACRDAVAAGAVVEDTRIARLLQAV